MVSVVADATQRGGKCATGQCEGRGRCIRCPVVRCYAAHGCSPVTRSRDRVGKPRNPSDTRCDALTTSDPVEPVPFNRATLAPGQIEMVTEAFTSGHVAGDGPFSDAAARRLSDLSGGGRVFLTPSCTDALEMCALLTGIGPGDEVIVPSYTFVSTANAFALFGATPVFADSDPATLNIDPESVASLISDRTRAIVVVHYGGVTCDMDALCKIASANGVYLIEDNAHGLFGFHQGRPLGSLGALSTLSFHETKNISCGEGGALVVNDTALVDRAEIIWEKGTNRSQFFRGQVDKYTWVDKGSSYLLAEPLAAALCAQLDFANEIQHRRRTAWDAYQQELATWASDHGIRLPYLPAVADHPSHLYWMACPDLTMRSAFIQHMRRHHVHAVFHYQALNASPAGVLLGGTPGGCPVAEAASDIIVRLPLFSDMKPDELRRVIEATLSFRGTA